MITGPIMRGSGGIASEDRGRAREAATAGWQIARHANDPTADRAGRSTAVQGRLVGALGGSGRGRRVVRFGLARGLEERAGEASLAARWPLARKPKWRMRWKPSGRVWRRKRRMNSPGVRRMVMAAPLRRGSFPGEGAGGRSPGTRGLLGRAARRGGRPGRGRSPGGGPHGVFG